MQHYSNTKVGKIEDKYGTLIFNMGLTHFMHIGCNVAMELTDEKIDELLETEEDGALFPLGAKKKVLQVAKELSECNLFADILPYIRVWMVCEPTMHKMHLCKTDVSEEKWQEICELFKLEEEEMVVLRAVRINN